MKNGEEGVSSVKGVRQKRKRTRIVEAKKGEFIAQRKKEEEPNLPRRPNVLNGQPSGKPMEENVHSRKKTLLIIMPLQEEKGKYRVRRCFKSRSAFNFRPKRTIEGTAEKGSRTGTGFMGINMSDRDRERLEEQCREKKFPLKNKPNRRPHRRQGPAKGPSYGETPLGKKNHEQEEMGELEMRGHFQSLPARSGEEGRGTKREIPVKQRTGWSYSFWRETK